VFIYGGGKFDSFFLSFFLLIEGGDYESGGGAATRNPFPAENIPEVACQDQSIPPHPSSHCNVSLNLPHLRYGTGPGSAPDT